MTKTFIFLKTLLYFLIKRVKIAPYCGKLSAWQGLPFSGSFLLCRTEGQPPCSTAKHIKYSKEPKDHIYFTPVLTVFQW